MNKTRLLVYVSILISMEIILTRFLSIQTPIIRISFGFIPIAVCGMLFGPVASGLAAMLSDLLGMMIFPQGPYFPGFTFSALITGAVYGLFLYGKPKTLLSIMLAVLTVTLAVDLGLNTLWLSMITGKAAYVLVLPRLIKSAAMLPVQVVLLHGIWKYAGARYLAALSGRTA